MLQRTWLRLGLVISCLPGLLLNSAIAAACVEHPQAGLRITGDSVLDSRAQLVWRRCLLGTTWNVRSKSCAGVVKGYSQKEAERAAKAFHGEWRLPTEPELETLLVDSCAGMKIDRRIFPNVAAADFGEGAKIWTSSQALPEMFYFLNFSNGGLDMHSAGFGLGILLVKEARRR